MEFRHLMLWHRNFDMSMLGCIDMEEMMSLSSKARVS